MTNFGHRGAYGTRTGIEIFSDDWIFELRATLALGEPITADEQLILDLCEYNGTHGFPSREWRQ